MEKEKIRLSNKQEFELIPMGISNSGNSRSFRLITTLSHEEVKALFLDTNNISQIEYILADGTVDRTYLDCTSLKSVNSLLNYKIDDSNVHDVIEVVLNVSEVERTLQNIDTEIDNLSNTVVMMSIL